MTGVVLHIAEAALSAENPIDLNSTPAQGNQNDRVITHWTYKVFLGGAALGAIIGVVATIFAMFSIAATGFLLGITNGLAAFYIKRFGALQSLEDSTSQLAKKVDDLKKTNAQLESVNKDLKEVPDRLRNELETAKNDMSQKSQELETVVEQFRVSEEKLQKFASITTSIQEKTQQLSEEAIAFAQQNNIFGERVELLAGEVIEVQRHHDDLTSLILQSDANTDEYEKLNQEFSKQIGVLDQLFVLMRELFLNAMGRMKNLEKQVDELEKVIPEAVQSAKDAEQIQTRMEDLQDKYKAMVEQLETALNTVEKYKKYKKAYRLLQKIKNLDNWSNIKQSLGKK